MRPAEALIFDMDGLLLDTETLYVKATQAVIEPYGMSVDLERYADWIGRNVTYEDFQALYPIPLTEEEAFAKLRDEFHRLCETELQLRPGVAEFLDGAARDYPKAIASSTRLETINHHLQVSGLDPHFLVRVSARDCPRGKPHPDVFEEAARQLGVEPAACVLFEDSPHGIAGGNVAGMRTVAVLTELTQHYCFVEADLVVPRIDAVTPEWLAGRS